MKILIIEDELPASRRLRKLLLEIDPEIEVVAVLESVSSSLIWFKQNPMPDLIISDIQLSDDISFTIFNKIEVKSPIIFTTAFDQYAIEAFEHLSIGYLIKPIRKSQLENALLKLETLQINKTPSEINKLIDIISDRQHRERFLVYSGENLLSVQASDIAYFYTDQGVTFIHTKNEKRYILNESLDKIENEVDKKAFFRANRKYIVSLASILKASPYFNQKLKLFLQPETDDEVMVSKLKATAFKDWLNV
jgi:two-component system response regulator LytT